MRLVCDAIIRSVEKCQSSTGTEYIKLKFNDNFNKFDTTFCVFSQKLGDRLLQLNQNDTVALIFEQFYSKKYNKDVFILKDVVECPN